MSNLEEGLRWLDQAEADLKTARDSSESENYYASAFFAQQAAEKALKGFLYSKGLRAILTHSVTELLDETRGWDESFRDLREYGQELDRHYIGSRYPNFYPSGAPYRYYNQEIAERCINFAGSILQNVQRSLNR